MATYQSLHVVLKPYSVFSNFQSTLSFSTPFGSWTYVTLLKGSDLKNAHETSIALKSHLRYAITARHNRMIRNCTVGADAFDSANSWNPFTQHLASNFRFPPNYDRVLLWPAAIGLFFIVSENRPSISDTIPEFPKKVSV